MPPEGTSLDFTTHNPRLCANKFVRKKRGAVVEKRVDKTSFTASPQPSVERNKPPSPLPSPEQEPDSELGNPVDASASQSRTADPGYVATNPSGLDKWQGYFSMIDEHSLECQDHESPSSAPLFVPTPAKPTPSRAFVHSHGKGSETHRQALAILTPRLNGRTPKAVATTPFADLASPAPIAMSATTLALLNAPQPHARQATQPDARQATAQQRTIDEGRESVGEGTDASATDSGGSSKHSGMHSSASSRKGSSKVSGVYGGSVCSSGDAEGTSEAKSVSENNCSDAAPLEAAAPQEAASVLYLGACEGLILGDSARTSLTATAAVSTGAAAEKRASSLHVATVQPPAVHAPLHASLHAVASKRADERSSFESSVCSRCSTGSASDSSTAGAAAGRLKRFGLTGGPARRIAAAKGGAARMQRHAAPTNAAPSGVTAAAPDTQRQPQRRTTAGFAAGEQGGDSAGNDGRQHPDASPPDADVSATQNVSSHGVVPLERSTEERESNGTGDGELGDDRDDGDSGERGVGEEGGVGAGRSVSEGEGADESLPVDADGGHAGGSVCDPPPLARARSQRKGTDHVGCRVAALRGCGSEVAAGVVEDAAVEDDAVEDDAVEDSSVVDSCGGDACGGGGAVALARIAEVGDEPRAAVDDARRLFEGLSLRSSRSVQACDEVERAARKEVAPDTQGAVGDMLADAKLTNGGRRGKEQHLLARAETDGLADAAVDACASAEPRISSGCDRILAWRLVFLTLSHSELLCALPRVCRAFRTLIDDLTELSSLLACMSAARPETASPSFSWEIVERAVPAGKLVAEGGYKKVYKVADGSRIVAGGAVAMSVLDMREMRKQGLQRQMETELWVSHLLSRLARHGRCPNFLQLYQCFQCSEAPPSEWGEPQLLLSADERSISEDSAGADDEVGASEASEGEGEVAARPTRKATRPTRRGANPPCYQYALMQFADGGDMEEACKRQPGAAWSTEQLLPLLFQMLFSVFVAQEELSLRHYDMKLLNFFLARAPETDGARSLVLRYGLHGAIYDLALEPGSPSLCMLADFGTAEINADTLGGRVCAHHLTTLENSAPECLCCGSEAEAAYAIDAWALGLCLLHLLTGHAPYEELMADLHCPEDLRTHIEAAWQDDSKEALGVVRTHLEDDEDGVLCDTLYRYLCLLGLQEEGTSACDDGDDSDGDDVASLVHRSAIWAAVCAWAKGDGGSERFGADHAEWSVFGGSHETVRRAQARMDELPGSSECLRGLLCFEPASRWSALDALKSDVFAPLRNASAERPSAHTEWQLHTVRVEHCVTIHSYMHYLE